MTQTISRRHAKTAKHQLCKNDQPCAFLLSPHIPPQDHRYHMSSEHCRLCAVFWDQRGKIPCMPKHGLKE